jgi:hypothetical protein
MRTTSRLFRTVLVAAGLLAISASAAQAMPTGLANAPEHDPLGAAKAVQVLHRSGFVLGHQLSFAAAQPMAAAADSPTNQVPVSVMQAAADSPTDQTTPLVINQPVPAVTTVSANNGFGWTDAGIGAAVAALLLILAGFAATRVRPRQPAAL